MRKRSAEQAATVMNVLKPYWAHHAKAIDLLMRRDNVGHVERRKGGGRLWI
jgi:hypothetical protein